MKKILVPLDISHATEPVLATTRELATALGAEVCLIHIEPPEPAFVGYEPGPQNVRDNVAQEAKEHHKQLHEMRDALKGEGIEAKVLLIQGPTVEKIVSEAERLDSDLIVMGSHGHGSVFDLLVGSVSEGVMRKSPCPVVVVPCRKSK